MKKSEKATLILLDLIFLAAALSAAAYGRLPEIPTGLFLVVLGLAANRLGLSISDNLIFKWLRDSLGVKEKKDSSGAGDSTEPVRSGWRRMLAELVCCPICSGTWAAMILLVIYATHPLFGRALLYALAAAGVSEVLTWLHEYLKWGGRAAREVSGSYWLEKNGRGNGSALFFDIYKRENTEANNG